MGDGPVLPTGVQTVREGPWDLPKSPLAVSSTTGPLVICKIPEILAGCQLRHSEYSPDVPIHTTLHAVWRMFHKLSPPPTFWIKLLRKVLFSTPTSLCCITCDYVKQVAPKKQHCSREGLKMKADTIWCYCINKRMPKEALQNQCMWAGLNVCELGVFSKELSKICPLPSLRSHLSSSPVGVYTKYKKALLILLVILAYLDSHANICSLSSVSTYKETYVSKNPTCRWLSFRILLYVPIISGW